MAEIVWLQSSIWSNRSKTTFLLILFPVLLFWIFFLVFLILWVGSKSTVEYSNENFSNQDYSAISNYSPDNIDSYWNINSTGSNINEYSNSNTIATSEVSSSWTKALQTSSSSNSSNKDSNALVGWLDNVFTAIDRYSNISPSDNINLALAETWYVFVFIWPILLIWMLISFVFYRQMIFSFTEAVPITRVEYPEIYNIVENLCISKWLPMPNIWILDDSSMNAFAVWWNIKKSWIVFSRWILEKMNKAEIEAVAWHELTHIVNKDWLLMVTIICFIWAIAWLWEILFRIWTRMSSRSRSDSKWGDVRAAIMLIWLLLLILWYLILPFVQLAVSRKREYLADAWSVVFTKDKLAMISALQKISIDSTIESIKKDTVSALCIANPFPVDIWLKSWFHEFMSTHPSIENRIEALQHY